MPMTFPSHQGFVAPLWRCWPGRFDVAALCVGAALPDLVDGIIGLWRGHFGQGIGHSLVGVAVLGLPVGMLARHLVCRAVRRLTPLEGGGFPSYAWNSGVATLAAAAGPWRKVVMSLVVGALAHLLFDLVSHGHFPWLIPWVPKVAIYPDWWYDEWLRLPLPWKPEGRKLGPHATIWLLLSLWGAWLFLSPVWQAWRAGRRPGQ
jgi:hypothetical protein